MQRALAPTGRASNLQLFHGNVIFYLFDAIGALDETGGETTGVVDGFSCNVGAAVLLAAARFAAANLMVC